MSMRNPFRLSIALTVLCLMSAPYAAIAEQVGDETVEEINSEQEQLEAVELDNGEDIFKHQWRAHEETVDGGDGLGPLHNDVSCAACHFQGGVGGGGTVDKNAVVLSLDARPKNMSRSELVQHATDIHPGFMADATNRSLAMRVFMTRGNKSSRLSKEQLSNFEKSIRAFASLQGSFVLHKFSTEEGYENFLSDFADYPMPKTDSAFDQANAERQIAADPIRAYEKQNKLRILLSQRNTPALFGVGLIEKIDNETLMKIAREQKKKGLVSGRFSQGKFGWKSQTTTLEEFVRGACANELGLNVPGAFQPESPLSDPTTATEMALDLSQEQLTMLTSYVATLPPPTELKHDDESLAETANHGKQVFSKVGCAECHRESIETKHVSVKGIYSDLLLHDLGANLADPVSAGGNSISGGGYNGGSSSPGNITTRFGEEPKNKREKLASLIVVTAQQEWRTPPLWGVSETAPYLHDGRASNLTEAILYHGGEAKFSVKRFVTLAPGDRLALLSFLSTLVPPEGDET